MGRTCTITSVVSVVASGAICCSSTTVVSSETRSVVTSVICLVRTTSAAVCASPTSIWISDGTTLSSSTGDTWRVISTSTVSVRSGMVSSLTCVVSSVTISMVISVTCLVTSSDTLTSAGVTSTAVSTGLTLSSCTGDTWPVSSTAIISTG